MNSLGLLAVYDSSSESASDGERDIDEDKTICGKREQVHDTLKNSEEIQSAKEVFGAGPLELVEKRKQLSPVDNKSQDVQDESVVNVVRRQKLSPETPDAKKPKFDNKCPKKLPLPSSVCEMFQEEQNSSDTPEQHGGRKRSFAHERGNWATFIFVRCPSDVEIFLREYARSALDILEDDWQLCEEFHISLSRTVPLAHHCIQPLVEGLKANLENINAVTVQLDPCVEFFTNDEKTRSFLSLQVAPSSTASLTELVNQVDNVFEDFRLEKYYENPKFHLSLAWKLGDAGKSDDFAENMQNVEIFFNQIVTENPFLFRFTFDKIDCKSGNKNMIVYLKNKI